MNTKQLQQEILDDTIRYYNNDPSLRALSRPNDNFNPTCTYATSDGRRCAVGRFLNSPPKQLFQSLHIVWNDLDWSWEYKKLGKNFWATLQGLHDAEQNWNETGLSKAGEEFVEAICEKFNLDPNSWKTGQSPSPSTNPQPSTPHPHSESPNNVSVKPFTVGFSAAESQEEKLQPQ